MKKILLVLVLSGFVFSGMYAQQGGRLKAQKVAFITNRLNLTSEESANFWPVYNEYHDKVQALKKKYNFKSVDFENLSEAEAEKVIRNHFEMETAMLNLKKEEFAELREVLPMTKIARLPIVEREFRKKVVKKAMKRKR